MKPDHSFSSVYGAIKGIVLAVLIFCYSLIYSQSSLNIMDLYHESFPDRNARVITANANIGNDIFHANTGGVSFLSTATPAEHLKEENVSLNFENGRLTVGIGANTFYADLPLWQLVPIINFTNSSYTVALSLLGNTTGSSEAKCRFHPAFLDNLLGLRLFQADLLNFTDILWDLPSDDQQKYILAPSEQNYIPQRDSVLHRVIYDKLISEGSFSSFVLTDKDVNFVFDFNESGLVFSGKPYYYFIRTVRDTENIRSIRSQLIECYNEIETHAKLLLGNLYTPDLHPRTNLGGLLQVLSANRQARIFNPYSAQYVEMYLVKLDSLNNLTDEEIGIHFQVLDNFSESFKPYWDILKTYNPPVYSAVENTAQWSAFFRYVRKVNPENWELFVQTIKSETAQNAPVVRTPTAYEINYFRLFDDLNR
jgi:hypothetical protein